MFESFNSRTNVDIYYRNNSNEASEQLVVWKARYLWWYEPFVNYVTDLVVDAAYNAQTTPSGILAMVMSCVKHIPIKNTVMIMNPLATYVVKTTQIHSWWYEEIARINLDQRNFDPQRSYISVPNEWSQRLFSLLTLCIRLLQRVLPPMQQWNTTARLQSTLFTNFGQRRIQRSGKW